MEGTYNNWKQETEDFTEFRKTKRCRLNPYKQLRQLWLNLNFEKSNFSSGCIAHQLPLPQSTLITYLLLTVMLLTARKATFSSSMKTKYIYAQEQRR